MAIMEELHDFPLPNILQSDDQQIRDFPLPNHLETGEYYSGKTVIVTNQTDICDN